MCDQCTTFGGIFTEVRETKRAEASSQTAHNQKLSTTAFGIIIYTKLSYIHCSPSSLILKKVAERGRPSPGVMMNRQKKSK